MKAPCNGAHDIYVAEVIGVESEGKVVVLAICRSCGYLEDTHVQVAQSPANLRLLHEEKKTQGAQT